MSTKSEKDPPEKPEQGKGKYEPTWPEPEKTEKKAPEKPAEKVLEKAPADPGVPTGPGITEPDPNDPGKGYRPLPGPDLTQPTEKK